METPGNGSFFSSALDSSFVMLPDDTTFTQEMLFKLYVTVLEFQTNSIGNCALQSLLQRKGAGNKELPKTTEIVRASGTPSWGQTFVFKLSDSLSLNQQYLNVQVFDMSLETSMSRSLGLKSLPLDVLFKHHNDVEWFNLQPQSRILIGFCFDEHDLLQEIVKRNLPIRRSLESTSLYPLLDGAAASESDLEAEKTLESSIMEELRKSTERELVADKLPPTTPAQDTQIPPPLPPRTNIPPPLPARSKLPPLPSAEPRWRPTVNWETVTDSWFLKRARDTDPDNISTHFNDVFDEFRSTREHAHVVKQLIGDEAGELICLFVPGLYAGRMPFKVRQDMNVVWGRRMGELQAMGLDARVIQVPIDGPVLLNATIIGSLIQDLHKVSPTKKFVLVGYSKGGVDFSATLSIMPELRPLIRCFITMFSPLYGSHIASDLNGSGISAITSLAVQKIMGLDPEAMRDLTVDARKLFLAKYPLPTDVPIVNLTGSILDAPSNLKFLYQYIKTRHGKESDGVVACSDAVVPGAKIIVLFNTDHKGAHEENRRYKDQVLLLASLICSAVEVTRARVPPIPPSVLAGELAGGNEYQ